MSVPRLWHDARAEALETALTSGASDSRLDSLDVELAQLLATAERLPALAASVTPRPEFVLALGERLQEAARAEPIGVPARPSPPTRTAKPAGGPIVFVTGRGLPRALAGATASVLLVAAAAGAVSRGALPGNPLYPLKEALDQVATQLAGSDRDRALTLLSQAENRTGDAESLLDGGNQRVDLLDEALGGAYDAAGAGQRLLLADFDRTRDPRDLAAAADFSVRLTPRLLSLRTRVPAEARGDVDRLLLLLRAGAEGVSRKAEACGAPCHAVGRTAAAMLAQPLPAGVDVSASGVLSSPTGVPGLTGPLAGAEASAPAGIAPSAVRPTAGSGGVRVQVPTVAPKIPRLPGGQTPRMPTKVTVKPPVVTVRPPLVRRAPTVRVTPPRVTVTLPTASPTLLLPSLTLAPKVPTPTLSEPTLRSPTLGTPTLRTPTLRAPTLRAPVVPTVVPRLPGSP